MEDAGRKLVFISTYAPTLDDSKKHPEVQEKYYQELEETINAVSKRDLLLIGGDMNAKTGVEAHKEYPDVVGRYSKGSEMNENGRELVECMFRNNILLTNTIFKHKMAHRTTWQGPERINEHKNKNNEIRRNPYRNQVYYVMIRKSYRNFVTDSRSYSGINTNTDHRLVKTSFTFDCHKLTNSKKVERIDYQRFNNQEVRDKYKETVSKKLAEKEEKEHLSISNQNKWNEATEICKDSAKEILGVKQSFKRSASDDINTLSEKLKKIRIDMNSSKTRSGRQILRKERNKILKEIHKKLKEEEVERIDELAKEIEKYKDDST